MNRQRFRLIPVAAGLAAIAVVAAPADPAAAAPPSCVGPTCGFSLYQQIHITGDIKGPFSSSPVSVTPPPCWYQPDVPNADPVAFVTWAIGGDPDAFVQNDGKTGKNTGPDPFGGGSTEGHLVTEELQHADAHVDVTANKLVFGGNPDAGKWYDLSGFAQLVNGKDECAMVPLDQFYVFVTPGQQPPLPPVPVPGKSIAEFVANHQTVPRPTVTLSPQDKGFVNLATYLWATWRRSVVTNTMTKYVTTGTLGPEQVTVTAVPVKFVINLTGPGNTYTSCTLTPDAAGYTGSQAPFRQPPRTAPGTPPDCGVLFTQASHATSISVTITWQRSWTGVNVPDAPGGALPDGSQTSRVTTIPIYDIQAINGTG